MAEKFEEELEMIIRRKSRQSELENLLRGYRICARSEGKSENTIRATETAITSLGDFLRSNRLSTDAAEIGPHQIRSFILHLGQVRAYAHHPYSRPRERGLSGHTVNSYLRAVRAFFSWLLKEEILSSSPFPRVKVPPAPRKVIPPSPRRSSRRCFCRWTPRSRRGSGAGRWFSPCLTVDSGRASWWGLRIEDLNLEEGTLRVYGKGGKGEAGPHRRQGAEGDLELPGAPPPGAGDSHVNHPVPDPGRGGGAAWPSSPAEPSPPEPPEEPEPAPPAPTPPPAPAPAPGEPDDEGPLGLAPGAWAGIGIGIALAVALMLCLVFRQRLRPGER